MNSYKVSCESFPQMVFKELLNLLNLQKAGSSPIIIDVGCGTGIATQQLTYIVAWIFGCDIDEKAIEVAKAEDRLGSVIYKVADTCNLPFEDNYAHAITAFNALHCFKDVVSMSEIKRVLKPNGIFFVVNKNSVGEKEDYYSDLLLECSGFVNIKETIFQITSLLEVRVISGIKK
jgi:ubiquinone/menaquinone biosynthesis C-methylase UbiE